MIVASVTVRNIRSFSSGETTIEFPEGTVLIEGDVGSGKSTILYAIEFALFGVSEMAGSYLLSEGRNEGYAEMTFVENGVTYAVHRGLKRGKKAISQDDCYIVAQGRKEFLSPTDLKGRIVDILKFNEPRSPKSQSLIYRFAVFTPQEKMKEIVSEDSAARLPTLRRVLGLEDYKVASDNSELVGRRIRTKLEGLRGASAGLEDKEAQAAALKEQVAGLDSMMPGLRAREAAASVRLNDLGRVQKELSGDRERLAAISGLLPEIERNVRRLEGELRSEAERLRKGGEKLAKNESAVREFRSSNPQADRSADKLEEERAKKQAELEGLVRIQAKLEQQLSETEDLIQKRECPLCGQAITKTSFAERSAHLRGELEGLAGKLEAAEKGISSLSHLQDEMREYEKENERVTRLSEESSDLRAAMSESEEKVKADAAELELLRGKLEALTAESDRMGGISAKIERLDDEIRAAKEERDAARDAVTEARARREEKSKELERVEKEAEAMRRMRGEAGRLAGYGVWLSGYFQPTVEAIERQMMIQMNSMFDGEFKRFYSTIMEDQELSVRVNEDFTPIFERESYEQDYEALSGGERTSVALAYRLALNSIVQEAATSSAGELLILDEPTEGFSKGQLHKIRDVLDELKCRQVILVSHERELEGMADHIFKVDKTNGVSTIRGT